MTKNKLTGNYDAVWRLGWSQQWSSWWQCRHVRRCPSWRCCIILVHEIIEILWNAPALCWTELRDQQLPGNKIHCSTEYCLAVNINRQ